MDTTQEMNLVKTNYCSWSMIIGTLGLILAIIGNFYLDSLLQKYLYFFAAVLLTGSAVLEKQTFFIILEIIVVVSTAIAFIPGYMLFKAAIPLLLSAIFLGNYLSSPQNRDILNLTGALGIILLALGYAIIHPAIYLAGGVVLTIFSSIAFARGVRIAILWAILNAVFSVTALYSILI